MRNNFYKVLRIIVLVLTIISLVFTISYKISKAADTFYPFASDEPLRVAPDMGTDFLDQQIIDALVNRIQSGPYPTGYPYNEHGFDNVNLIVFREHNSNTHSMQVRVFYDGYISDFTWPSDYETNSNFATFSSLNRYSLIIEYDYVNDTITYVSSSTGSVTLSFYAIGNTNCYIENLTPGALVSVYALIPDKNIINYPIYLRDGDLSYNGFVRFASNYSSGGESSDQDIIDNIDDNDLPQVDDSDPQDPSSVTSWLKKILAGIKTFNNNQNGIGKTMIDLLKDFKGLLSDNPIKEFMDDYKAAKNTTPQDVVSAFNSSDLGVSYNTIKGDITSFTGLFDVAAANTAPYYEIPLTGTLLENNIYPSIIIDFALYDDWRPLIQSVLCSIIAITFIYNFLRSLPDIFNGDSGDES